MQRREFLSSAAAGVLRAGTGGQDFTLPIIPAPDDPRLWPEYRRALAVWRADIRKRLGYDGALYLRRDFAWAPSSFACSAGTTLSCCGTPTRASGSTRGTTARARIGRGHAGGESPNGSRKAAGRGMAARGGGACVSALPVGQRNAGRRVQRGRTRRDDGGPGVSRGTVAVRVLRSSRIRFGLRSVSSQRELTRYCRRLRPG